MAEEGVRRWRIRLAAAAENDFRNIIRWTSEHFGERQASIYSDTLSRALEALSAGPSIAGARERREIADGLMTLHVARGGRRGRHFVLYRAESQSEVSVIEVLRLLHDSMDLPRHLDPEGEDSP